MKLKKFLTIAGLVGLTAIGAYALTLQEAGIENPEGKSVMPKDVPPKPRLYAIPLQKETALLVIVLRIQKDVET